MHAWQGDRMVSELVEHYRSLLRGRSWRIEGLSWTVIQPAGQPVTVEVVKRRLQAEPINLDEIRFPHVNDLRPDDPSPFLVAHLAQVGSSVVMFQANGFEGARPEVLRWLSDGARVHNVDWTINGNGGISYAVYSTVLTWIDKNDPSRRGGTAPDAMDEDLTDLTTARRMRDADERPASELICEAAAMATVERRTGVRLPTAWVDDLGSQPWQVVMLGRIPNDPDPPSGFGRVDPDLDARLRGAHETVRRAAVLHVLRWLSIRFTLSDEEAAAKAMDAVERGVSLDDELHTRVFRLHASAATPVGEVATAESSSTNPRMVGQAFYQAVAGQHTDPLDALAAARSALPGQWPQLRRELLDLIRTHQADDA